MNKTNLLAQRLLAGVVAVAMFSMALRANAEDIAQSIIVTKISGGARYSMDGGRTFIGLHQGDILKPGALIQTSEKGTVDVILGEPHGVVATPIASPVSSPSAMANGGGGGPRTAPKANVIRILPNSVLTVDKLTLERTGMDEVSDTQLDLKAGTIIGNVKKLSAASRYEIKIPNGVAGIRGTIYMIGANGAVYVLRGSVVVSYVDGQGQLHTVTVSAGYGYNPISQVTTPLGPGEIRHLEEIYTGPPNTPPIDYTKNRTVIHISPD